MNWKDVLLGFLVATALWATTLVLYQEFCPEVKNSKQNEVYIYGGPKETVPQKIPPNILPDNE